ncbi:hypothetical protein [Ramlibacter sp.]|uniref:hypothetical protein n=1 Tax=Ramlibacter sp. TaxID=1917967 RepID=UPI00260FC260|nr:hypothetical protein [Ramlibacter sp.]
MMHARAGRRPYVRHASRADAKELSALTAEAAFASFTLVQMEDDAGCEVLIATRGAETIRFENREQVGAWLNHLHARGAIAGSWLDVGAERRSGDPEARQRS